MWKIMKQRSVSLEDDFPVNSTEKRSHHDSRRVTVNLSYLPPQDSPFNAMPNCEQKGRIRTYFRGGVSICTQWQGCAIVLRYMQYWDPTALQSGLDTICAGPSIRADVVQKLIEIHHYLLKSNARVATPSRSYRASGASARAGKVTNPRVRASKATRAGARVGKVAGSRARAARAHFAILLMSMSIFLETHSATK